MGQLSSIEWTDHTFNPWWGCTKISPGCTHCYAETWSNRYGHDIWGPRKKRRTFGEAHWQEPMKWQRLAEKNGQRVRVFCASMADVFEDNPSVVTERQKLWSVIEETPKLDWLLLTKRPENMIRFAPWKEAWPENVWAMTSVENQAQADKRLPILEEVPAVVKGLSVEPLIGPVDLTSWLSKIQWVIVGGESGRDARPMHIDWVRQIRDQTKANGIPFFFKQWGEWAPCLMETTDTRVQIQPGTNSKEDHFAKRVGKKNSGRILDEQVWNELPHIAEDLQLSFINKG